ncbi:MAG: hypothetical protein MRJ68_16310 [Nitrospira sp.]|nr:hypothetical protein [Nitrospira sp.]
MKQGISNTSTLGRQVLKNLAEGREAMNRERQERADFLRRIIANYVLLEEQAGRPRWGRAGRIARKLHGQIGERQVRKYLEQLTKGSDSHRYDAKHNLQGGLAS